MAGQFKLPIARVLTADQSADHFATLASDERVAIVDLRLLRQTKSYAKLTAQTEGWSQEQRDDFLLAMMAQGPV